MPEKRVTVGPYRARYPRTGAPAPTPGDTKRTYWRVARGAGEVFKEGGERREEKCQAVYPTRFSNFIPERWKKIACCGRTRLGVGADHLYVMEDTCTWSPG